MIREPIEFDAIFLHNREARASWHDERCHPTDVKYIRSDLVEAMIKEAVSRHSIDAMIEMQKAADMKTASIIRLFSR